MRAFPYCLFNIINMLSLFLQIYGFHGWEITNNYFVKYVRFLIFILTINYVRFVIDTDKKLITNRNICLSFLLIYVLHAHPALTLDFQSDKIWYVSFYFNNSIVKYLNLCNLFGSLIKHKLRYTYIATQFAHNL